MMGIRKVPDVPEVPEVPCTHITDTSDLGQRHVFLGESFSEIQASDTPKQLYSVQSSTPIVAGMTQMCNLKSFEHA